eukprot:5820164-Prymnesium_polylepis.1
MGVTNCNSQFIKRTTTWCDRGAVDQKGGSNHLPHAWPGQRVAMGCSNYQLLGALKVMGGATSIALGDAIEGLGG